MCNKRKMKNHMMKTIVAFIALACLTGCKGPNININISDGSGKSQPALSEDRLKSLATLQKLTDYEDLNIYSMEIFYDYNLDNLTPVGVYDDQEIVNLIVEEAMPGVGATLTAPQFGCTAFTLEADDGKVYLGRNYDFKWDSSAIQVVCHPKDGYSSIAYGALNNVGANDPFASDEAKVACLASPFICLDGMNEKGLGIAVLTLDSEPTAQNTGKPVLATPIVIRMVLDKCATTQEAVDLMLKYDAFSTSGRDYHFYVTDASGDGRIIEFDCEKEDRPLVATPIRTITNYYGLYEDKVVSGQPNGMYGKGKERRDKVEAAIEAAGDNTDMSTVWDGCKAAATEPNPESVISNTQWSAVYNLTDLTHEFALHRHWEDIKSFDNFWIK